MRRALAISCCLVLLASAGAWRAVEVPRPKSRWAREVIVRWGASGRQTRLREQGRHELEFPCSHVPGRAERFAVEISGPAEDDYVDCTPAEVAAFAREGRREKVRFTDALTRQRLDAGATSRHVWVAEGRLVAAGAAFTTGQGILCVVAEDGADTAELIRATPPGQDLVLEGRVLGMMAGRPCVAIDAARGAGPEGGDDEPPWTAAVEWPTGPGVLVDQRGEHDLWRYPCGHAEGAVEFVQIRVRGFPLVDLDVGGHAVTAELADTRESRLYGAQGRAGFGPDHGMLFWWPRPFGAVMVMKQVTFPLSVAFIAADGTIVNIEDLNPGDPREAAAIAPVPFVLEMERGWFAEHGIAPGDRVLLPGQPDPPGEEEAT